MYKSWLALAGIALSSSIASAGSSLYEQGWYMGAGVSLFQYEDKSLGEVVAVDQTGVELRGGYQYSRVVAFEGRLGVGTGDESDSLTLGGTSYEAVMEILGYGGVYLKTGIPNTRWVYPYLLFGATVIQNEIGLPEIGFSDSGTGADLSFGAGIDINWNERFSANVEYLNMYNKDRVEITGLSFGLNLRF